MTDLEKHRAMRHVKQALFSDYPNLLNTIIRGGNFGGEYSAAVANRMYSRTDQRAIDDATEKMTIEQHGDHSYLIRFPFVNVAAFDTDEGLVLVDCGYAPAGPGLVKAAESIGDKPVHTIVLTHFHADHAFGAWALLEAGHEPEIVATAAYTAEMQADIDTWGLNVRYNNQFPSDVPRDWDVAYTPTLQFHDEITLTVGGVDFELREARGETADQLWVWVPERSIVVSADYYQRFLPNAGNGKRRQRHPQDWAKALRDMADYRPGLALPMHGPALTDPADIQDRFRSHADILDSIAEQVLDGLNSGLKRDDAVAAVVMPTQHTDRDDVAETYVTVRDIAKMVAGQYTGWWDDIASHWSPPPIEAQAAELAHLVGGPEVLISRGLELIDTDPKLACQLADWAHYAAPDDNEIRRHSIAIYVARIEHDDTPTQEALIYLDHLAELKSGITE